MNGIRNEKLSLYFTSTLNAIYSIVPSREERFAVRVKKTRHKKMQIVTCKYNGLSSDSVIFLDFTMDRNCSLEQILFIQCILVPLVVNETKELS